MKDEYFYFHLPLPEKLFTLSEKKDKITLNSLNEVFVYDLKIDKGVMWWCCFMNKIKDVRKIISDNLRKTAIFAPKSHKKDSENSPYAVGGWYSER